MNTAHKTQRTFMGVTMLTVVAVTTVFIVYAAIQLGLYTGEEVRVGTPGTGSIRYSLINQESATWNSTLSVSATNIPWYCRLEIAAGGYVGPVTVDWQLHQKQTDDTWMDLGTIIETTTVLNGTAEFVYASSNGALTGNQDWSMSGYATTSASYNVEATMSTTG